MEILKIKKFFAGLFFIFAALALNAAKPNIVFILADDLGYGDISFNGQGKITTPNIDKIAKGGISFTRHYSGAPVCAPSRCTLMTGLHTGHAYIRGNLATTSTAKPRDGDREMPEGTLTVAQALKNAGYATGLFGKWGLGAMDTHSSPLKMGFDRFYGYNGQGKAHSYYPPYLWSDNKKVYFKENENGACGAYSADKINEQALDFIEKSIDANKPFFLYYATTLPHAEMHTEPKYMDKYRGKFLPEKKFENKKGSGYRSQPEGHAAFAGMIEALDTHVGSVLKLLEEKGQLENTLIFFSSDNGPHQEGGHDPQYWNSSGGAKGIKRDLYEGGIRTPMFAMWKGAIAPNTKTNHVSAFWDFFPTIAQLTGATLPEKTDGISYLPTLLGKGAQKKHDYLYWEFHERGGKQAVLKDGFKLVKLNVNIPSQTVYELYDLANDPKEERDISKQNAKKFEELKKILENARVESELPEFNFKK